MIKFIFLILFVLSCSHTPAKDKKPTLQLGPRREEFLGKWIGEQTTPDGKIVRWLADRRADGNFTLAFFVKDSPTDTRKFDPEKALYEIGIWGVSGDIFFTSTRQYFEHGKIANFDTTKAELYDAYQVLSFDGNTMVYRNLEDGVVYTMKKLQPDQKIEL
jgi:hypothetical protein